MKLIVRTQHHCQNASVLRERVRWQHSELQQRGIDQTRLALENAPQEFSEFLVFGIRRQPVRGRHRSSSAPAPGSSTVDEPPSRGQNLFLHTGDVVYLVGSSEQYREKFHQALSRVD